MSQFQFVVRKGPNPGKIYALAKTEIYVGRDISCDIAINDSEISRKHAHLVRVAEGYAIEDLGSTNGTFINEVRIAGQAMLNPGQLIRMGDNVVLAYEMVGYDPQATLASGAERISAEQGAVPMQPPVQPAQQQAYVPAPPPPAGYYAGQIPDSPPHTGTLTPPGSRSSLRWLAIGCAALLLLGACILIGMFWYIDANFLWCDVFGGLIPACR
ncbi:MAG: FHA domain-containing protein [Chloroflexi bacterium]|nr:FHA domain-containing protein [Chloroflexota bacterium]